MVNVEDVHKSFGPVPAVRGVSFELRAGAVTGLLGPNGAGKTTTIRMIAGFILPDAGRITVGGHDSALSPAAARRRLGYLPEANPLYPEMKTREYLQYRARLYGIARPYRRKSVDFALERCRLRDVAGRRIGALSKGYRQRVGLASALVHNPQVLILDEPTNGLDPTQIRESRTLVRELAQDRAMLLCSHILTEVEKTCDRVLIFSRGKIRADGTPAELTRAGGGRYVVVARDARVGEPERALKIWQGLPHVADASARRVDAPAPGGLSWTEWTITTRAGAADVREHIFNAARDGGLVLRELRADVPTLESVFMGLLEQEDAPAPGSTRA